ncbi:uncharacterized protein TNCV_2371901 [Trichonephila clavipes]|nr:uncharacterized protein TNCV_2371901 [Trichonephila clavipes]
MIACFVEENHENWDRFLHEFAFALRTSVNETRSKTPAELFLGRKIITPFSKLINVTEGAEYVGRNIEKLFVESRQNMQKQHKRLGKNTKIGKGERLTSKGKKVTVNIEQVRVYRPRQSDTIGSDSHVETLYEGQRSSNGLSRSQPGKSKRSRKTSSEESKCRKSNKGNAGWEDPRLKRKVGSNRSVESTDKKRSKICRKRSLHVSKKGDQKIPTPELTQVIKRTHTIPYSVSSRKDKYMRPNNPSQGSQSIAGPSHQIDRRQCKPPTEGSTQGASAQYDRARETRTTPSRGNSAAERRPVRFRQVTAVRPCPYYLRSRVKQPKGIPEEQRSNGNDSIPQKNLRRRSLSIEALDGDPVDRSE